MLENSPDETKTQTEKDFNLGFVKQIGDIGLIVRWICSRCSSPCCWWSATPWRKRARAGARARGHENLRFSDGRVLGFVLAKRLRSACSAAWGGLAWPRCGCDGGKEAVADNFSCASMPGCG